MVIKAKLLGKNEGATPFGGPSTKEFAAKREFVFRRDFAGKRNFGVPATKPSTRLQVDLLEAEETVDVIDLGAPRRLRRAAPAPPAARASPAARRVYTPNPRLYPGPAPRPRRRPRSSGRAGRSRRRVFRRPVPNARLYRPAPRRLPPPAEPPRGPWPPPQPPQPRALDTASRAALRLAAQRPPPLPPLLPHYAPALRRAPDRPHAHSRYSSGEGSALLGRGSVGSAGSVPAAAPPRARRLVVTLPAAAARAAMDARRSPDDGSEADALSAPSEFLAEFLSAIMRRQHVEALKYCRLILQYEPHNATARGFYPLLQHKVRALQQNAGAGSSSGSSAYSPAQQSPRSHSSGRSADDSRSARESWEGVGRAVGSRSGSRSRSGSGSGASLGSGASQSSLELDSSSGASGRTRSRSEPASDARDDNGNVPAAPAHAHASARADDVENDNDVSHIKSESSASLRRLRAQFACSIK